MVRLRPATADDIEAVAALLMHTRKTSMPYLPVLHSPDEDRAWMRDVVFARCDLWVAEWGGRLAGFVAVHDDVLEHLYVHPDLHRRGIGRALLAKACELRPAGFRLWTFQQNARARRFYESRGLRVTRTTDGAGNEERLPDVEFAWRPS